MRWEFSGTGLAFIGVGLTLMLALPPPWWLKMPSPLVHLGITLGGVFVIVGASLAIFGAWAIFPAPRIPFVGMVLGGAVLLASALWFWVGETEAPLASRAATTDRHLTREQEIALSDELQRLGWQPENVTLRYFNGCIECLRYAADFSEALKWAGWSGQNDTTFDANPELTGVQIVVERLADKPHDAELLASALKHANIDFQWSAWEPPLITPVVLFVYPAP
jgi:hypothetical protein